MRVGSVYPPVGWRSHTKETQASVPPTYLFGLGLSAPLAYRRLRWLYDGSITLALLI